MKNKITTEPIILWYKKTLKKYDGKIIETIQSHKKIKFDDFGKIYDKDAIDHQLRKLIQCGLVTLNDGWLEAKA